MAISYKPLWKLLIDRDMTKKALMQETGISKSTVDKMGRGENVSLEIIDRICKQLDCNISEVIECEIWPNFFKSVIPDSI